VAKDMGRRDGLLGQSQHIIQSMKQKKDVATTLATEAITVQLGSDQSLKEAAARRANRRLPAMEA